MRSKDLGSIDFNYMIRLKIGLESDIVEKLLKVCPGVVEGKTSVSKKSSSFQGPDTYLFSKISFYGV